MSHKYYDIDETAARRAKDANSFYDYKPGNATASYRAEADKAIEIAENQKSRVDPMYHAKIDRLCRADRHGSPRQGAHVR